MTSGKVLSRSPVTHLGPAIAFGYFETLFLLRDTARVSTELTRIKGFNKLLDAVGQQEHLYEIFVDATEDLFGQILEAIEEGSYDDSFLLEAFNAEYNSSAIITHFRVGPLFLGRPLSSPTSSGVKSMANF